MSQGEQKMAAETGNLAFLRQNAFFLFKKIFKKKTNGKVRKMKDSPFEWYINVNSWFYRSRSIIDHAAVFLSFSDGADWHRLFSYTYLFQRLFSCVASNFLIKRNIVSDGRDLDKSFSGLFQTARIGTDFFFIHTFFSVCFWPSLQTF